MNGAATRGRAGSWAGLWFVSPAMAFIIVFFFIPAIVSLGLSLTTFDIYALSDFGNVRFVGLANYERLFATPLFWKALANTFYFVVLGAPLSVALSLAAALLVNAPAARFKGFYRALFFAPFVTTLVATAVIWRYLLHTRYGLVNEMLGLAGLGPVDWLGNPSASMPAIVLFSVWKNFGYAMMLLLAGLQTIPRDLYEAARIDGAGSWQQFRHVTLPGIAPVLLVVTIMTVANYFQLFAEPYVMTQGEPAQSTVSILYLMFEQGFKWWDLGFASTVAFVLFVIMLAVSLAQLALARRQGAV